MDSRILFYLIAMAVFAGIAVAGPTGLTTYEVVEAPSAPPAGGACGDAVCQSSETCTSCQADCGVCTPEPVCGDALCQSPETCSTCSGDCGVCPSDTGSPASPPAGGSSDVGGGSGGGGGGGGGGSGGGGGGGGGGGTGSSGLKALTRNLEFSSLEAEKPAIISLMVSNGIPTPLSFAVAIRIQKGQLIVHSDEVKTSQLNSGQNMKINFDKSWKPATAGEYKVRVSLFSSNKKTTYDVQEKIITVNGNVAPQPEQPQITQEPDKVGTGDSNDEVPLEEPLNPEGETPQEQNEQGIDSKTLIIAISIIIALATIIGGSRMIKHN